MIARLQGVGHMRHSQHQIVAVVTDVEVEVVEVEDDVEIFQNLGVGVELRHVDPRGFV